MDRFSDFQLVDQGGPIDNAVMPSFLKKSSPKPSRKVTAKQRSARKADVAERRKIGRTLDLAAFFNAHKKNSKAARYWEQEE